MILVGFMSDLVANVIFLRSILQIVGARSDFRLILLIFFLNFVIFVISPEITNFLLASTRDAFKFYSPIFAKMCIFNFCSSPSKILNANFVHFYCRVKERLEGLTTSLIAWKQFESGLNEFNEALGKDTGTLKRLTGALELGTDDDAITNNLAHDVKEVAKRLSENQNAIAMAAAQQVIAHRTLVRLSLLGTIGDGAICFSAMLMWKRANR